MTNRPKSPAEEIRRDSQPEEGVPERIWIQRNGVKRARNLAHGPYFFGSDEGCEEYVRSYVAKTALDAAVAEKDRELSHVRAILMGEHIGGDLVEHCKQRIRRAQENLELTARQYETIQALRASQAEVEGKVWSTVEIVVSGFGRDIRKADLIEALVAARDGKE
jgi:hypothetical protein